jgi:hypothetical protein
MLQVEGCRRSINADTDADGRQKGSGGRTKGGSGGCGYTQVQKYNDCGVLSTRVPLLYGRALSVKVKIRAGMGGAGVSLKSPLYSETHARASRSGGPYLYWDFEPLVKG